MGKDIKKFCAGVHVLVQKGNKYLVLQRSKSDDEDPNFWDLPGGGINFSEQPMAAAIRETKEEAGINIKIVKLLSTLAMPYQNKWSIEMIVAGKYVSGKIKLSEEHLNYKWVSKKELRAIKPKSAHIKSLLKNI